ncbi:MAG: lysophospholipid acyltransferase family protein [Methylocystis sp.]|nr:lysophospholipid acyltransferase family protein [Methylocystis sp.]MCA3582371.1 lysophospholipid acyltransferase family protein [Methylocystis sp.]MCA3588266.1 lysophospholipid acyltransferase family protein [Methylocystis sp.]MCA3590184.1 lysophospholipid acyltransferase family protein [Methylocystis sp.]
MLKKILRSRPVLRGAGKAMAVYLTLVRRTNRFTVEPADAEASIYPLVPAIIAMWHGQHFMAAFIKRPQDEVAAMISRHGDGEINAIAVEALGMRTVRGSGAQRQDQVRKRGGAQALRAAMTMLEDGVSVAMTADVPKVSRVAGRGIITLGQLSGRPIIPVAVVTSRRKDFDSWDRTSIGLPYGRGAIVFGAPISIGRDAAPEEIEAARLAVQEGLDAAHARAYAIVGDVDPGAGRASVAEARAQAAAAAAGAQADGLN